MGSAMAATSQSNGGRAVARAAVLGAMLAATAVCGPGPGRAGPLPVTPGTQVTPDALDKAIAQYEKTGQTQAIAAFIAANPDDERSAIWHELLALAAYDRAWSLGEFDEGRNDLEDPAPVVNTRDLRAVVSAYPGTFAARMAGAGLVTQAHVVESTALRQLVRPVINQRVVAFLSGQDSWVAQLPGGDDDGVQIDLRSFRRRNAASLQQGLADALQTDGCTSAMGYCQWFVVQFPADPATVAIGKAMKRQWYERAHPPWKSKAHLQCAYDCSHRCRAQPTLDDACYEGCFSKC